MESESPIKESRWHRPNLYVTILAVFQLFSGTIMVVISLYVFTLATYDLPYTVDSKEALLLFGLPAIILASIGSIPIISSVLLFRKRRSGLRLSAISLVLSLFIFPSSIFFKSGVMSNSLFAGDSTTPIVLSTIGLVSVIAMFPILLKARKQTDWNNNQPKINNQNDSSK